MVEEGVEVRVEEVEEAFDLELRYDDDHMQINLYGCRRCSCTKSS